MRLFAAALIPENIASDIYMFAQRFLSFFDSKPVKPENMHITLNFFGNADEEKCLKITGNAVKGAGNFKINVKGLGCFSYGTYASVLWAGIEDSDGMLSKLAVRTLNRKKDFVPHITLARFKNDTAAKDILENRLAEMSAAQKEFGSFTAEKVSLLESLLHPEGTKYRTVKDFTL